MPIEAGYDNTLLHHFGGSVPKVKDYIAGVIELSRLNFISNNSLPFKVIFKWSSQINNIGFGTRADDLCKGHDLPLKLHEFINKRKKSTMGNRPLVIFTEDLDSSTVGCAGMERACGPTNDGKNLAIVDMYGKDKSPQQRAQDAARILSHEIGHLVSVHLCLIICTIVVTYSTFSAWHET